MPELDNKEKYIGKLHFGISVIYYGLKLLQHIHFLEYFKKKYDSFLILYKEYGH